MRFRYHRGAFQDSMATTIEVENWQELIEAVRRDTGNKEAIHEIRTEPYEDKRNDWDNHWLLVDGKIVGTTDGNPIA